MSNKIKTTSKKQKLVGTQTYIDSSTGEAIPMIITSIEDRDFNFHKVWLEHLIMSLDEITNRKMELAFWIIDNLNRDNMLTMTQRQIIEKTGLSMKTVSTTMRLLQDGEVPFLKKLHSGLYQVNPDVIYKGSHTSRMGIVFDYTKSDTKKQQDTTENDSKTAEPTPIDKEAVQMELDEVLVKLQNSADMPDTEKKALKERKTALKAMLRSA